MFYDEQNAAELVFALPPLPPFLRKNVIASENTCAIVSDKSSLKSSSYVNIHAFYEMLLSGCLPNGTRFPIYCTIFDPMLPFNM